MDFIRKQHFFPFIFSPIFVYFFAHFTRFLFIAPVKSCFLEGLLAFLPIATNRLRIKEALISTPAPAKSFKSQTAFWWVLLALFQNVGIIFCCGLPFTTTLPLPFWTDWPCSLVLPNDSRYTGLWHTNLFRNISTWCQVILMKCHNTCTLSRANICHLVIASRLSRALHQYTTCK